MAAICCRHGEHHVEVGHVEQFGLAVFEPLGARQALALRAVPVTAGVVGATNEPTIVTVLDMATERRRAASLDRRHHTALGATMIRVACRYAGP